ncbi:hypothetical protein M8J76_007771 [Diaphorina citri]|nr:hypothetical protein M8J75_002988 [Diaphorina citri]KAI5740836.1 hypothetical protein M8J76_007771 [Diaphorina citri]
MGNGIPHAESETFHAKDMGISREVRATSVISALNDDIGNLCKDDSDNSPDKKHLKKEEEEEEEEAEEEEGGGGEEEDEKEEEVLASPSTR